MKELAILSVLREGALPEGKGAFLEVETNEGPRQLRFTLDEAQALLSALQNALKDFADDTTQDAQVPRTEIDRIARFLEQALKRFDSGGEMRQ